MGDNIKIGGSTSTDSCITGTPLKTPKCRTFGGAAKESHLTHKLERGTGGSVYFTDKNEKRHLLRGIGWAGSPRHNQQVKLLRGNDGQVFFLNAKNQLWAAPKYLTEKYSKSLSTTVFTDYIQHLHDRKSSFVKNFLSGSFTFERTGKPIQDASLDSGRTATKTETPQSDGHYPHIDRWGRRRA